MKKFRKLSILLLALFLCFSNTLTCFAASENLSLQKGVPDVLQTVSYILDNTPSTKTISLSEQELVMQMLENNEITREDLNRELISLTEKTNSELQRAGYSEKQVAIIRSYEVGDDAFNHVFGISSTARATAGSGAEVTFRYGLAGTNTQRDIRIAYDITWSECPFWTFTDSFGVGFIAADKNSKQIMMKIDSSEATVQYYNPSTDEYAGLYRNVSMNDFSNCVVIGDPIMGSAQGNYGKRIGGVTNVSTQSGSFNIYTIQLFVAYAHTIISLDLNWDVSLGWSKSESAISFSPSIDVQQEMMVQDKHTFKYSDQTVITAP